MRRAVIGIAAAGAILVASCGDGGTTEAGAGEPGRPIIPADPVQVDQIPGDDASDVPSALDNMTDGSFPDPLIDPAAIRSGGPPPDGIPAIDAPNFEVASSIDWLQDDEPVLFLQVDDEARAYPIQIMTWHELVNDTFGDVPVTISYCPLCNSALAYVRAVDGRILDFGTSGRLYNSSLVMYDRQTESLWTHFTGEAVIGALTGTKLETLPIATISWATFVEAHPDALVLNRDTGFSRDYGRNPYPGYDDVNSSPFLFDGEVDGRLPAQARVVSIRVGDESVAVDHASLVEDRVLATTVGGQDVVVWLEPGTSSALEAGQVADGRDVGAAGVFVPEVDGRSLRFTPLDDGGFTDTETNSTWTILGTATDGPLAGAQLRAVEHLDTFWFAIAAFAPDTIVIP